jgi:thiosulfate dehydrogenase [quinone] large subunit
MVRLPRPLAAGAALTPVRLFLGLTFVYAGYQKLSDPGYLHAGSPTYIGTQLKAFSHGTPGGFMLRWFALPIPTVAGVGVALAEIAIGLLVTVGLMTRIAAAAGLALNLLLFLTASWNTHPYFLGSDIVFVFAWLPFVLAGADGQPAVDHQVERSAARERRREGMRTYDGRPRGATRAQILQDALSATAVGTLAIAGIGYLLRGSYTGPTLTAARTPQSGAGTGSKTHHHHHRSSGGSGGSGAGGTTSGSTGSNLPSGASRIASASSLQAGQAATYSDPGDGSTDIVVRLSGGGLSALSAICTHAGCEVSYEGGVLACPCHGSQFNPTTGAVLQGPAITPLSRKRVVESGGEIYAVPS